MFGAIVADVLRLVPSALADVTARGSALTYLRSRHHCRHTGRDRPRRWPLESAIRPLEPCLRDLRRECGLGAAGGVDLRVAGFSTAHEHAAKLAPHASSGPDYAHQDYAAS